MLGVSKGNSKINKIYRYGVDRLYSVIFFNKNTCINTSTIKRSTLIIIVLIILFLQSLQSLLFFREFIVYYINILQFTKINRKGYFHI